MNVNVIIKPFPHCPIPYGHPLYRGFVPSEHTNIVNTWAKSLGDDYDLVQRQDWLDRGFKQ